ncbi:MAG: Rrf2 family transcriptional regulator [Pirellulaceae bacterium]|jgi:Rrf2 family protein|nr:Rrf2 family transcriptional regulator [Pirellulaceae bacterium]
MLSATSQHAIRALVHLAQTPDGQSALGRDIAQSAGIPANFLAKILLMLRNAGFVDTTRGLGGGYRLAMNPDQITIMEVAELFDGVNARPGCFLGEKHACNDQEACSAHSRWKNVYEAYLNFMTTTTIADIGLHS